MWWMFVVTTRNTAVLPIVLFCSSAATNPIFQPGRMSRLSKSLVLIEHNTFSCSPLLLFPVCILLLLCLYHIVSSSLIVSLEAFAVCRPATPPWACPVLLSWWCNHVVSYFCYYFVSFTTRFVRADCAFLDSALLKAEPSSFD